jgi:hypothetical protein
VYTQAPICFLPHPADELFQTALIVISLIRTTLRVFPQSRWKVHVLKENADDADGSFT